VRHLKSPVSPSNPIHNADDCGKDYEGFGTEIANASPAVVPRLLVQSSPHFIPHQVQIGDIDQLTDILDCMHHSGCAGL
jgi:hypothetical protein